MQNFNTAPRSHNHCCNGNATMRSLCTAELHIAINNTRTMSVAQQRFYEELLSPKNTQVFM